MSLRVSVLLALAALYVLPMQAQSEEDAFLIKQLHTVSLSQGKAYGWLEHLSERIGGRLAGSPQAEAAVRYTYSELEGLGLDRVWLQPCRVPHWERGAPEVALVKQSGRQPERQLNALALGKSAGTGPAGIEGTIIEVKSLEEVELLGDRVQGGIVFFNRPMDQGELHTFHAYGKAVDQRVYGPAKAAQYGAIGAVVRSMTTSTTPDRPRPTPAHRRAESNSPRRSQARTAVSTGCRPAMSAETPDAIPRSTATNTPPR